MPSFTSQLRVHLHPDLVAADAFGGGIAVVIDALRASVTITAALAAGAACVVPVRTVEGASEIAARLGAGLGGDRRGTQSPLLGGERAGVLIPGFDLDNSPTTYTAERVGGRAIVFTTTNGTRGLLHAAGADVVLVASFANLSAVCGALAGDARPLHILCCGTGAEVTFEDVLVAGAIVDRLGGGVGDDSARLALAAWRGAEGDLPGAMRASRGGRNLIARGLGGDVEFCARVDTYRVVPRFNTRTNRIV